MSATRLVHDSMGELEVPADALYGAQTQRAIENFPVSGQRMPESFIRALIIIKVAAAKTNVTLAKLSPELGGAIEKACQQLLSSPDLMTHFPVDIFQTGSGTSSNMNANEVIATLASQLSGLTIHPNDHVNLGQSSNDVIPTSIHVSATIALKTQLLPALEYLIRAIEARKPELKQYCKTGRTHLMDAMPIRMDQAIGSWQAQLQQQHHLLAPILAQLLQLPLGGTAVGTGVNAHPHFAAQFNQQLSADTGLAFSPAPNFFALMGAQDTAVSLSGATKSIAVTIMKIANDLRWMNSGPLSGLGEIALPALQPGSSIMPGKVNPVIPESAAMVAAQVIGNDAAITIGGQSGNFELNVMLPMIASNLLNSIELLSNSLRLLADKAIAGFTVLPDNLNRALHRNPVLVTALNEKIGYEKAASIAKKAYQQQRPILDVALELSGLDEETLIRLLDPVALTGDEHK